MSSESPSTPATDPQATPPSAPEPPADSGSPAPPSAPASEERPEGSAPRAAAARRRGLGRGLSALLGEDADPPGEGDAAPDPEDATGATTRAPQRLPLSALVPNPVQPRRVFDEEAIADLAESIRSKGILTPILVRPAPDHSGAFQIVAGERRWRAAQRAQLHEVPVLIRDLDDKETLEVALVENLQRQDLNPLEEAEGFHRLMEDFGHTQDGLARVLGKSRSHVANTLRLTHLPAPIKEMVGAGQLTAGHARALLTAPDAVALAEKVVAKGLNVRQTEKLAQQAQAAPDGRPRAARGARQAKDPDTLALERDLSNTLGLPVSIDTRRDGGGQVTVGFDSLGQLDEIIQRLSRSLSGPAIGPAIGPVPDAADETEGLADLVALDGPS